MYNDFMTYLTVTDARYHLPNLVGKVSSGLEKIVVTVKGVPKAVLVSFDELEALEETAEIISIPFAKKQIILGLKQAKAKKGIQLNNLA